MYASLIVRHYLRRLAVGDNMVFKCALGLQAMGELEHLVSSVVHSVCRFGCVWFLCWFTAYLSRRDFKPQLFFRKTTKNI